MSFNFFVRNIETTCPYPYVFTREALTINPFVIVTRTTRSFHHFGVLG